MDTQPANRIWLPTQPRHYTTREKIPLSRQLLKMGTRWPETCWATYKDRLIRRNKYNTKWHLVGFLFHIKIIFVCLFVVLNCGSFFTRILIRKKNILAACRLCTNVIIHFRALISPIIITLPQFPTFKIFLFSQRIFLVSILSPRSHKKGCTQLTSFSHFHLILNTVIRIRNQSYWENWIFVFTI